MFQNLKLLQGPVSARKVLVLEWDAWYRLVSLATQEAEAGRWQFQVFAIVQWYRMLASIHRALGSIPYIEKIIKLAGKVA